MRRKNLSQEPIWVSLALQLLRQSITIKRCPTLESFSMIIWMARSFATTWELLGNSWGKISEEFGKYTPWTAMFWSMMELFPVMDRLSSTRTSTWIVQRITLQLWKISKIYQKTNKNWKSSFQLWRRGTTIKLCSSTPLKHKNSKPSCKNSSWRWTTWRNQLKTKNMWKLQKALRNRSNNWRRRWCSFPKESNKSRNKCQKALYFQISSKRTTFLVLATSERLKIYPACKSPSGKGTRQSRSSRNMIGRLIR